MYHSALRPSITSAQPSAAPRYTPDGPSPADLVKSKRLAARAPHPHRGLPLAFVRSAIFAVGGVGEKITEKKVLPLGAMPTPPEGYCGNEGTPTIAYTGLRLGQTHALIWQALMSVALDGPIDMTSKAITIKTTRGALLEAIGVKSDTAKARKQVWRYLKEIKTGEIDLKTPRHLYCASLISEIELDIKTGLLTAVVPTRVFSLLCDEIVAIPLKQKHALGKDAVAHWLHDFLSSQSNDPARMIPWAISTLFALSGCRSTLRAFRSNVKKAAAKLAAGPAPLLSKWAIDKDDRLVYTKKKTKVVLLPPQAKKVEQIQSFHSDEVSAARLQRERAHMC